MKGDRNTPNQASNTSKAEGERWSSESDTVEQQDKTRNTDERTSGMDEDAGGISNRPLEEEVENQERVPDRGESHAHAGHGDRSHNRTGHHDTPRRYDEDPSDPTMPSDDSALNTKI